MSNVKIIKVNNHLRVQFKDGNMLPETDLIIKDPVELNTEIVEVTVSFLADISELVNDKDFKKKSIEINRLNTKIDELKKQLKESVKY